MHIYNLALIGFGGVNRALAELVRDRFSQPNELGFTLRIVAITNLSFGTWIDDRGIEPQTALSIGAARGFCEFAGGSVEVDHYRAIVESAADIVIEATYTNRTSGEPATSHIRWALSAGKHASTTNKGRVRCSEPSFTSLLACTASASSTRAVF